MTYETASKQLLSPVKQDPKVRRADISQYMDRYIPNGKPDKKIRLFLHDPTPSEFRGFSS